MLSVHLTSEPGTNCQAMLSTASQLHSLHNAGHYDLIVITPAAWGHWVVISPSISWDISPGIIGINEMPSTQVSGPTHCTPIPHLVAFHSCHLKLYFPHSTAQLFYICKAWRAGEREGMSCRSYANGKWNMRRMCAVCGRQGAGT